ncbi:MAG: ATP-dependent zinc metalloprotease FtsH [Candidatus Onthoplasma sp.]
MEKKQNSVWKSLLVYGIIALILIAIVVFVTSQNDKGKEIQYSEFVQLVEENKIEQVDIYGYTIRIRKVGGVDKSKFPKQMDAYCQVQAINNVYELLKEHNDNLEYQMEADGVTPVVDENGNKVLKEGQVYISYGGEWEQESWFSQMLPYISVAVIIIMGIFMFKAMSGNNKGFGFGKSKAKLVVSSKVKFSDVAGAEEEKQELEEIVEFLKNPARFTELGARIPKGVLLVGPPGTGKTLLAKAVAGESKVSFFSISGSDFVELYVGVGASRVRDLFDTAKENAPCIVFIDEIDAVGRQRGAGLGGGNDEREQTLNQLLVEMDGFESNSGIIVLAATNRADVLDPALTRPGRFDRQIYVHLPDVKGREEILKVHSKNKPMSEDVDFKRIARLTSGLAGADIENMLNEAALLCARDHRYKITMVDIQEGLNKVLMGPKKVSRVITEKDKRITAIHEAGHAIIAQTLDNCDNVQEISIIPRGMAGGYTLTFDEKDNLHMTKQKLLDTLAMMLGGRSAEETMLDDITTGASNDMERATKLARKMVAEWGMTDEIGLMSFGEGEEIFVGRDYQRQMPYGQELASKIDEEVKIIIDNAHARAKKILSDKVDVLKKVEQILLDKETIYKEEFEMLFNGSSVEEVEIAIDKKEKDKKEYQEKAKREAQIEHKVRDIKARLASAEALSKSGVITKQDFENIKKEAEQELQKIYAQNANENANQNDSTKQESDEANKTSDDNEHKDNKDEDKKG